MNYRKLWLLPLCAALVLSAIPAAQAQTACSLPGELLLEDATGDTGVPTAAATVPVPLAAADIVSLHAAEPDSLPGKLVFTYKVASLATTTPLLAYILRFATEVPPDNGDEDYFVAMLTQTDGSVVFVHGTNGFTAGVPAEPRQFRIAGDLDPASNFNADGTITLVLDKAAVPGIEKGLAVFNILQTTRIVTPSELPLPFFTNAANETIIDSAPGSGFYEVAGDCGAGKSGLLGAGALPLSLLLPFGLLAFRKSRHFNTCRRTFIVSLALASSAAQADGSGTLEESALTLSYTSPAYVMANPVGFASGEAPVCVDGVPLCDSYTLTVNLSDSFRAGAPNAFVDFTVESAGDFDLHIQDAAGNEVVRSENDGGEFVTLDLATLPNGDYRVLLVPFIAAGDTAQLDIALSGQNGKSGSVLAGAPSALTLLMMGGLAALGFRRRHKY